MRYFLYILTLLLTTLSSFAIDRSNLNAYDIELNNVFTQLYKEVNPILNASWREKFNYWGVINYTDNPNVYLPPNIKRLCERYVGVELGKVAETYRYSQRVQLLTEDRLFKAKDIRVIYKTEVFIPDILNVHDELAVARFGIQNYVFNTPGYLFKDGKIYNDNKRIDIYFRNGKGLSVRVVKSLEDLRQYPHNEGGVMGVKIPHFNNSAFWGWLALLSKKNVTCTTTLAKEVFPACPYIGKYSNNRDLIAAWALIADHTTVLPGKRYTVELVDLQ